MPSQTTETQIFFRAFGSLLLGARLFLVNLWFFVTALIVLITALFRPMHPSNGARWRAWVSPISLWLLGVRLTVRGGERFRGDKPGIFIVNHQTLLDVYSFGSVIPAETITIGKKSIKWVPLFGWLFYLSGNLLIDRSNRNRAVATLNEAELVAQKGQPILMCPEGTRSKGRGLLPFKKGAFHLAIAAQVPLRPFVVSSYHKSLDLRRWRAGKVIVESMPLIETTGLTLADVDGLILRTRNAMLAVLDRLDAELQPPRV